MNRSAPRLVLALGLALASAAQADDPGGIEQTIRFSSVRSAFYGDPDFELFATASSGLPVVFTASGDCVVGGSTVHILSAGKCIVTAGQPGDARFAPATEVVRRLSIGKMSQAIRFPPPPGKVYLDADFTPDVTATSGLPITLEASGDCSADGATVHILGAGSCALSAHQSGDPNFTAAQIVDQEFPIAKAEQVITYSFGALGLIPGAGLIPLTARASSGLRVGVTAWGACAFNGTSVQIVGPGTCTIDLFQPGDRNFNPAPVVEQSMEIPEP